MEDNADQYKSCPDKADSLIFSEMCQLAESAHTGSVPWLVQIHHWIFCAGSQIGSVITLSMASVFLGRRHQQTRAWGLSEI